MSRLLDDPWVVSEEAERISTHGGLGSIDFNGAEKERREAMQLVAQTQAMARALLSFMRWEKELADSGDAGFWNAEEQEEYRMAEDVLRKAGILP